MYIHVSILSQTPLPPRGGQILNHRTFQGSPQVEVFKPLEFPQGEEWLLFRKAPSDHTDIYANEMSRVGAFNSFRVGAGCSGETDPVMRGVQLWAKWEQPHPWQRGEYLEAESSHMVNGSSGHTCLMKPW